MDSINLTPFFLSMLWPILGAAVFILVIKVVFELVIPDLIKSYKNKKRFQAGKQWRSERELLTWLKGMTPSDFEKYISELFKNLGFKSEAIGQSHDGGIDVIIEKDGKKSYVQCKKYMSSVVSVSEVRDFYGALADRLGEGQGYFITTNKFTLEAVKFTEDKPIELVDGFKLVEYIRLSEKNKPEENVVVKATMVENCPKCGAQLVERNGKRGRFIGCSSYPKCTFTKSV